MFAVISIKTKQFVVKPGDVIAVNSLPGKEGDAVEVDGVLLLADGKTVKVGAPYVGKVAVKAEIVKQYRGEKLNVRRYKHKVRSRRSIGFRSNLTDVKITQIG
jgi:large subunit ribosomal protein L21